MTNSLTSKTESLIATMKQGDDLARHGFDLLSKRPKPEVYFDIIVQAGFFAASNNPGPVESKPGFVHIPFWPALNFLEAVARRAEELNDPVLANKVIEVVRSVSNFRDQNNARRDNHYTYWKFAEILGMLPTQVVTADDVRLVRTWISSKYDRGLVAKTLGSTVLTRFLNSSDPKDLEKACILFEEVTAFEWNDEERTGQDAETLIDDFWLKELINRNAATFGAKAGKRAADIFAARLREMFSDKRRSLGSSTWRPAIEDSPQNHDFRGIENRFVEGYRNVLNGWILIRPEEAKTYVEGVLKDSSEIIRRVALYMVTEHFEVLQPVFESNISAKLFTSGQWHEMYRLLQQHFSALSNEAKDVVLKSLRDLTPPKGEDSERRLKRNQRDWLSAFKDAGYGPVTEWWAALTADPTLGGMSEHPDYLVYHEMRTGPGPTPLAAEALIAFAKDGTIIEHLHAFQEKDAWRGPTLGGLISALEAAVVKAPHEFLALLDSFHSARVEFQHAVLNGFKTLLSQQPGQEPQLDWTEVWPKLLKYFDRCVRASDFWTEAPEDDRRMLPNRNWVVSLISDFLQAGTRTDEKGYPEDLLPLGWQVICTMLPKVAPSEAPENDPMTHAINTSKGRLIEAMINHALRVCRIAHRNGKSVPDAWATVSAPFNDEVNKCNNANFEFSTLAATYIANIEFMSADWLTANVSKIFPKEYPENFSCAVGGLAFARPTKSIYRMLAKEGVFIRVLEDLQDRSTSRERMIEWVCLAYLWQEERLDSGTFKLLFNERGEAADLRTASQFFWQLHDEKFDAPQVELIVKFWGAAAEWAIGQKETPALLLSSLSRLVVYLTELDERGKTLLMAVAPYVYANYNVDQLVDELARFEADNSQAVVEVLKKMFDKNTPDWDLDDKLLEMIKRLAARGYREDAIQFTERLRRTLPKMYDLYKELRGGPAAA